MLPWCDEAWFATPGLNLVAKGQFGTSTLDETSGWGQRNLKGIRTHTYWILPLHPLLVAGWSVVAGKSLFAIRLLSTAWGVVALLAWFAIARTLSGETRAALIAAALMAIDFQFLWSAGVARMDMMTEALIASSFAAFLWLREKDFARAVLASQALMACAAMTHPITLGAFAGLVFLTLYFDWRQVRVRHVALAVAPYLVAGFGWWLYIREDPAMFWGQFYGNITGRLARQEGLLGSLWAQFRERFLYIYGLAPDTQVSRTSRSCCSWSMRARVDGGTTRCRRFPGAPRIPGAVMADRGADRVVFGAGSTSAGVLPGAHHGSGDRADRAGDRLDVADEARGGVGDGGSDGDSAGADIGDGVTYAGRCVSQGVPRRRPSYSEVAHGRQKG